MTVLDLILEDARVLTLDPRYPHAHRIGVWNGRIVGRDDEIDGLTAHETVRLDGATVLPGFVDAHTHLGWSGRSAQSLDLSGAQNREALLAAIAAHAAATDGEWIDAVGYDQRSLDGVHITAAELDTVTGGRKAYLLHRSGHACAVNSAVLAEIDPAELAAFGANVVRDVSGAPTGVLLEAAQGPVQERRRPYELTEMI